MRVGLAGGLAALALVGCAGGEQPAGEALRERLEGLRLSVRSIACVDSELLFRGEPVYRCTVNFGDPHLVPYCAAIVDGRLLTDRERPTLACYRPEDEERYRDAALLDSPS